MKKSSTYVPYLKALAVLSAISLVIYYFTRLYFFAVAGEGIVDEFFAAALLLAEAYMIIHAFAYSIAILRINRKKKRYRSKKLDPQNLPEVALAVVARNEPIEILEQTFITLKSMDYAAKQIYLLDGSVDAAFIEADRQLCKRYGVTHFLSADPAQGTKGKIINAFLRSIEVEYVALFDADQNPFPDFLKRIVPIAESDQKIAFVQTPQYYSNAAVSPIARGASMQQAIFFEGTCESKGTVNAMFFCGTNALFRRQILLECGGMDEVSITEDFSTSVDIHARGYKSVYYDHVLVFGMAPESLPGYFRQQARWAAGSTGVLRKVLKYFFKNPLAMTPSQWSEYFLSGTYYFIGWSFFLLALSPAIYILFHVPTYFLEFHVYLATFVPYFLMTFTMFYITMEKRNYSFSEVYNGIIMGSLSFPVTMVAALKGLFGAKLTFEVTPKGKADRLSAWKLFPWIFMLALCAAAIAKGLWDYRLNRYDIDANMFWCAYHLFILSHIFQLNRAPKLPTKPVYMP